MLNIGILIIVQKHCLILIIRNGFYQLAFRWEQKLNLNL